MTKIKEAKKKQLKLQKKELFLYKRNGYYRLKGNKYIEFCLDAVEHYFNVSDRFLILKVHPKSKRGYVQVTFKKPDILFTEIVLTLKKKVHTFLIWNSCYREISKLIDTTQPVYIKISKQ